MYYLFFVDDKGLVGMDMIFFDFLNLLKGCYGIDSIFCVVFWVFSDVVFEYWFNCFE